MSGDAHPAGVASPGAEPARTRRWAFGAGAGVVLGVVAASVAWLVLERADDAGTATTAAATTLVSTTPTVREARPAIASPAALRAAAASSPLPIYWVGTRPGTRIEFTRAPDGTLFVRYLPPGVRAGATGTYLTVVTYPRPNGFAEVRSAASNDGASTIRLAGGGIGVYDRDRPRNVHLAYPGEPYQIEIFAPERELARSLVAAGAVRPVG